MIPVTKMTMGLVALAQVEGEVIVLCKLNDDYRVTQVIKKIVLHSKLFNTFA